MNAQLLATIAMTLGLATTAQAQSTPIEQWKMIEGKGLTDNYVYLGMTRAEVLTRTSTTGCNGTVSTCFFWAQDNAEAAPLIELYFNAKNKVSRIDVYQKYSSIKWPTKRGAIEPMTPEQVQALYPGSTIQWNGAATYKVIAARQGYIYDYTYSCNSDDTCDLNISHTIKKRQKD